MQKGIEISERILAWAKALGRSTVPLELKSSGLLRVPEPCSIEIHILARTDKVIAIQMDRQHGIDLARNFADDPRLRKYKFNATVKFSAGKYEVLERGNSFFLIELDHKEPIVRPVEFKNKSGSTFQLTASKMPMQNWPSGVSRFITGGLILL